MWVLSSGGDTICLQNKSQIDPVQLSSSVTFGFISDCPVETKPLLFGFDCILLLSSLSPSLCFVITLIVWSSFHQITAASLKTQIFFLCRVSGSLLSVKLCLKLLQTSAVTCLSLIVVCKLKEARGRQLYVVSMAAGQTVWYEINGCGVCIRCDGWTKRSY